MNSKPEHRSRWVNKRTYRVAIVWRDEISEDSVFYRYEDYWYQEISGECHDVHGEFYELPIARFHELFIPQVILGAGRPRTSDDTLRRKLGSEWFPVAITTSTKFVHRYRSSG